MRPTIKDATDRPRIPNSQRLCVQHAWSSPCEAAIKDIEDWNVEYEKLAETLENLRERWGHQQRRILNRSTRRAREEWRRLIVLVG